MDFIVIIYSMLYRFFLVFLIRLFNQTQNKYYTCFRFVPGSHAEHVYNIKIQYPQK